MHEILICQSIHCVIPQLVEQRQRIRERSAGKARLTERVGNIVRHPSKAKRMAIYYAGKCLSHDSVTAANLIGHQSDVYSLHIASIHEICRQCQKPANVGSEANVIGWRPAG